MMDRRRSRKTWISPSGLRTATAEVVRPRIMTPSRTAWPPKKNVSWLTAPLILVPAQRRWPQRAQRGSGLSLPLLALLEPVDAALRIDHSLLAAEEGMAHRTDLGLELFLSRAGGELVAAQADDHGIVVVGRMDGGFRGAPNSISRWRTSGACQRPVRRAARGKRLLR